MLRALGELEIVGVATTTPAHVALLSHPDFAAAAHSTKWVEDEFDASVFAAAPGAGTPATATADDDAESLVERTVPVEVDGKRFSVRLWLPVGAAAAPAARQRTARPRPGATGGGGSAGTGTISAPMQGTIVKVLVAIGDAVEAGQALLVLEAMKMENHINAETSGAVTEIRVGEGDTVGTGDILVVIE
jgi:acetyl-CoA/propionyl-CoA carboxylase biotin carboxyl carrier protein